MAMTAAVRAFLEQQRVGHLATVAPDGAPHVVPVCYALVGEAVYSVVDDKPKRSTRLQRLRNIQAHPRAALIVDRYDDADWSRLAWVLLRGPAAVLEAGAEHARAIAALRDRYPQYRTMRLDDRPVIRLTAERITSWGFGADAERG